MKCYVGQCCFLLSIYSIVPFGTSGGTRFFNIASTFCSSFHLSMYVDIRLALN